MTLRFAHSRDGLLIFAPDALATIQSFAQRTPDALEAGGLLFGRLSHDDRDVTIDRVTTPKPGDKPSRYGFLLESPLHAREGHQIWEETAGSCFHVGDWHTHAEPHPRPSADDLASWREAMVRDFKPGHAAFFVIVGTMEIAVWEGVVAARELRKLVARLP